MRSLRVLLALCVLAAGEASGGTSISNGRLPYPSLATVENALLTTAKVDFGGRSKAFEAATAWNGERLRASHQEGVHARAPHLCCADYGRGRETSSRLQELLSPEAVRPVAHSEEHGACFFATASHAEAEAVLDDHDQYGVKSFGPFPSALKIAPGVLEHSHERSVRPAGRLGARHGASMRKDNVVGLNIELAPGTLPAHSLEADSFISELLGDLTSGAMDLHSTNFWSDPGLAEGEHLASLGGASRAQDWSNAATVVHTLSEAASIPPGDVCSWGSVAMHHSGDDVLLLSGLGHLLYSGRGAGGTSKDGEAQELHVACFMGLVSFLAGRIEVLRVAPRHKAKLLDASARAIIQSATTADTPLTDAGLDGTGQVIQVVDTGLDESSCYFAHDATGDPVPHGYYFDEYGINVDPAYLYYSSSSSSYDSFNYTDDFWDYDDSFNFTADDSNYNGAYDFNYTDDFWDYDDSFNFTADDSNYNGAYSSGTYSVSPSSIQSYYSFESERRFSGGDFTAYPDRRKIIQYINMVKSDDTPGSHGDSFTTSGGEKWPWFPAEYFETDDEAGHGTHVAGSAAGATLNNPAEPVTCGNGTVLSCVGGCIDGNLSVTDDDLVSYYAQYADIDRLCPAFGCDNTGDEECLGDDVSATLTNNGGMAQGAKLAIFDVFMFNFGWWEHVGNDLWEPCVEADCKIHSNSWGEDLCEVGSLDLMFDEFMYKNPENLLLFAAGNDGENKNVSCTVGTPATAKNVLSVGATTSGDARLSTTEMVHPEITATIDTVATFSAYGPTLDGRIKPEVVAPGDMVYSAASDGSEEAHSCRLWAYAGTSMSCPIVAGASAMVRQYFMNESFYAMDMTARGFCDDWSGCEAFSPSAATVKALLINSANLMGGDSEPNGVRGFGRIHLEAGMPLDGEGDLVLFVADAAVTAVPELTRHEYSFDVDAEAGVDFRATLSWIDPPASTFSSKQLVHDLDLSAISPSGTTYTMWASGETDDTNVNERVIVDAADVESGTWAVWVSAKALSTDEQSYSLVVNGAINPAGGVVVTESSSSMLSANLRMSFVMCFALASAMASKSLVVF